MRAVVNDPDLVALHGTSPQAVQRLSWSIGASFAALSGVLIAPTMGIDSVAMTFLVVQAFGAAAIGAFSNIPLTYVGALVVGVVLNRHHEVLDRLRQLCAASTPRCRSSCS